MTGRIVGFETRADCGLRRPKSFSRRIAPNKGGIAVHYGGPAQKLDGHAECKRRWKGWQGFHMDERGWSDLAYTMGVCDHGFAFAGRGAGVRTAANGTNAGNDSFYAVVWLGGDGEQPSALAQDAIEWCIQELRVNGGAGTSVRPHRSFRSTSCPGGPLVAFSATVDRQTITTSETINQEDEDEMTIKQGDSGPVVGLIQQCLVNESALVGRPPPLPRYGADLDFGAETALAVKRYQDAAKVPVTGVVDGITAALLFRYEHPAAVVPADGAA